MMQDDPIAVYRIAGGGHGLVHGRGPCDERAAAGQWTDPSCAKMASGLIRWCSLATSDQAAARSSEYSQSTIASALASPTGASSKAGAAAAAERSEGGRAG